MAKQASDNQLQESPEAPPVRPHHRMWHWTKTHKKVAIPAAIVVVAGLLAGIPFTRYALAGVILKQTYTVTVLDQQTNKPVSSATVMLKGEQAKTDSKGKASLKTAVGNGRLTVEKKYYAAAKKTVLVPIFKQKDVTEIKIRATGRQVPVTVINKISKRPLANAKVAALGAEVKTDAKGQALLVLPADKQKVMASVSAAGYNEAKAEVTVTTDIVGENTFLLTPVGKIYFLSNQSGNIDVVKSNLDGSDRKVVLAGTGKEDHNNTILLSSRDWKYLALYSRRDGGDYSKLFLIDTTTDKVSVMDEGAASFELLGWSDHRFVYFVSRDNLKNWEAKKQAVKSFDADKNKLTAIDETQVDGDENRYAYQRFQDIKVVDDKVIYVIFWHKDYYYGPSDPLIGKTATIRAIDTTGQNKKDLKAVDSYGYSIYSRLSGPQGVLFAVSHHTVGYEFYEYQAGNLKQVQLTEDAFFGAVYQTKILSPSGNSTFWAEGRDGKSVLLTGDKDGANGKQVASTSESHAFGWFTDDYLLVSKKGSELYITPADARGGSQELVRITGYFRPEYASEGYGGGYSAF